MHKRSCFWKPFHSERVKEFQKLLKCAEKYCHSIFTSFFAKISSRQSFSVKYEKLRLVLNTLTRAYQYSGSNRENLPLHIQRQSFEKLKLFTEFFIALLKCTLRLKYLEKHRPHSGCISEVIDCERDAYLNA